MFGKWSFCRSRLPGAAAGARFKAPGHETDHLGGMLYIDKAETRSLCANSGYHHWATPGIDRAAQDLGF